MKEFFDLISEDGTLLGQTKERALVHRDGDLHRTSHVWIARRENSRWELMLQKRSLSKDSYPGCLDISSAGHIPAGEDFVPSALREMQEELGIMAKPEELHFLFARHTHREHVFHDELFVNNELSHVFLYTQPVDINRLTLEEDEVLSVCWMDLDAVLRLVKDDSPLTCLDIDEVTGVCNYLNAQ